MEIFFCLFLVIGKLAMDHAAEKRANRYAGIVIRRYD